VFEPAAHIIGAVEFVRDQPVRKNESGPYGFLREKVN
jgi:hypothetical protein